ncbi:MAG: hypothetical protein ACREMY_23230, partial [bacterium]
AYAVLQDDTGNGTIFGVRAPVNVIPVLTFEPYYATSSLDDASETLGGLEYKRSGFDMTGFGVSAILGANGTFYPFAGIGSWKLSRTGSEDVTNTTWNFGVGVKIPAGAKISFHIRGELDMIVDGDASRKFGTATAGLSYNLFSKE